MDLQGYELLALKSLNDKIKNVKYIITEISFMQTYVNGCSFKELHEYLISNNFRIESNMNELFHFEMNCLYINNNVK